MSKHKCPACYPDRTRQTDSAMSDIVLVTGCSRGIGLGLVEQFCQAGLVVVATCRNPATATELAALLGETILTIQVKVL